MFLDLLDKLREKPESVRFRIALFSAGAITAVIVLVWFSVVALQFGDSSVQTEESTQSIFGTIATPFVNVLKTGGDKFNSLFDGLGTIEYEAQNELKNK